MTILLTKVRPPQRRKDVLRRLRLVDILHQNLHRKLTFVSAPAGYGKTTLLVDFADDVDAQVFWYLIGPDDNDLGQFVRHIVAAFQQQVPNFGENIEQALSGPSGPDPAGLSAELINEIETRVSDFSLLVLDDYHLAGENERIADFIEHFLEHLPDQLRLLMGSRSVYGIPTANLYIRDELVTISADELRFRADELQRLVSQNYHVRLSQEQAEELAARADGWIVAIMLAVRSMENGALPKFSGATDQVYDFLAQEVVQRQRPELRNFMLATSIFDDFDRAVCDYVLEREDTDASLRALEERNLFVTRTETNAGPIYRYHQLFSEFLRQQLANTDPERLAHLHHRAADWYQQREQWELAIRHKLAAGEREEAAQWMDQVALDFYARGRQALLSRWVDTLAKPPDQRPLAPTLLLYEAKALINQIELDISAELLEIAEARFSREENHEALANTLITLGMLRRYQSNFRDVVEFAEKAQSLLSKLPKSLGQKHQYFQAERLRAIGTFYVGDKEAALDILYDAIAGLREIISGLGEKEQQPYLYDLAQALSDVGLFCISLGKILPAQKALREALDIHTSKGGNPSSLTVVQNNMAYLLHQSGAYKEAWREYQLALHNAQTSNRYRMQLVIMNGLGDLFRDVEAWKEAERCYRQAIALGEEHQLTNDLDASYAGLAEIERVLGNYSNAMQYLRTSASLQGTALDPADFHVYQGRIYMDMKRYELALGEFDKVIKERKPNELPSVAQVLGTFYRAYILHELDEVKEAAAILELALEGAAKLGYDNFLVVAARPFLGFLEKAQATLDSPQLSSFIKSIYNFQTSKSIWVEDEPDELTPSLHLEVSAFGSGQVRINGELLTPSDWRSSRARALFFYILDRGKARKETIGLNFWPDFSPGKVSSNFHATLWRVRQALGHKDAIQFEDDVYSLHPAITVWYDVLEFERLINQAKESEITARSRTEFNQQAVKLYTGDYLEDVFMDWVNERREDLQADYIEALEQLAKSKHAAKRYQEAIDLYKKIVEVEPYQDNVHLTIMECLVESGSPSAARAHFLDYKQMLHKELNSEPIPELQKFIERLAA